MQRVKHFVFKDGTEIVRTYEKGDTEALGLLTDQKVQDEHFPEMIQDRYTNPLVRAYETES